jgi:signal peptidase I
MEPTLHCARPGAGCEADISDQVVVHEPASDPKRGDIVVFFTPHLAAFMCGSEGKFIGRVIGLPGDSWQERDGFVYINGKKLSEPYMKLDRRDDRSIGLADIPPRNTYKQIPKGLYLEMGDNRRVSCDSRMFGLVPLRNITGTMVRIIR